MARNYQVQASVICWKLLETIEYREGSAEGRNGHPAAQTSPDIEPFTFSMFNIFIPDIAVD